MENHGGSYGSVVGHASNVSSSSNTHGRSNSDDQGDVLTVSANPYVRGSDGNLICLNERLRAVGRMVVEFKTSTIDAPDVHEMSAPRAGSAYYPALRLSTEITVRLVVGSLDQQQQQQQQQAQQHPHDVVDETAAESGHDSGGHGTGHASSAEAPMELFKFDPLKLRKDAGTLQDEVRHHLKECYAKCCLVFCVWLVGEYDRMMLAATGSGGGGGGGQEGVDTVGDVDQGMIGNGGASAAAAAAAADVGGVVVDVAQEDDDEEEVQVHHHRAPVQYGQVLWTNLLQSIDGSPKTRWGRLLAMYHTRATDCVER
jgi:hypothetical protein